MTSIILGTSAAAATSRHECIESIGLPASTVRMPISAAVIGPMVLPHARSERTTKRCVLARPALEVRPTLAVGRVRLVDVDLHDRPAAEHGLVLWLVTVGVVWMDGVGHVGRAQERPGDGAMIVLGGVARESLQTASQEVRRGALCGLAITNALSARRPTRHND
jgi:hypothetical protein